MKVKTLDNVVSMGNSTADYLKLMNEFCSFSDEEQQEFSSVNLLLFKLNNLPFLKEYVHDAIEKAIFESKEFSPHSITEKFTEIYPELINHLFLNQELQEEELEEEPQQLYYQYSTFCSHTLPQSATEMTESVTEYTNNKLSISCIKGLPYGGVARLIILYVNSMAVKYKSRDIDIGKSIKEFVERLGYTPSYLENGINEQVLTQLEKLFYTNYVNSTVTKTLNSNSEYIIEKKETRLHLFDATVTWEHVKNNFTTASVAKVRLSEVYFNEILKHPVPLSLDAIKSMKKSPLALDLYAFISYRANTKRVVPAKLSELKKQFCFDGPNWRFKSNVQRAMTYVTKAWPECNVLIKGDVLLIHRMATHIPKK